MAETFIPLNDTDEFDAFWLDNAEAFEAEGITRDFAFQAACNQSLVIGGGAAPMFRVGFVD
jgi:hypothetical protein